MTRLAAVTGALVALRLAAWQWGRAGARDEPLHYAYAVEWAALAVVAVVVAVRPRRRPRLDDGAPPRDVRGRLLGPPLREGEALRETTRTTVLRVLRAGR